jgi:hypothetical protein
VAVIAGEMVKKRMNTGWIRLGAAACALAMVVSVDEGTASAQIRFGRPSLLHAHNCYPDEGKWADRIERVLALGLSQVAIEQDLAWVPASRGRAARSVVSHSDKPTGAEPTLEEHFFARIRPIMEKALADNRRDRWPLLVLHLDFKTNEPEHHRFVWNLLQRHERWLTTAARVGDGLTVMPLNAGPLLVLTENGPGQEVTFSDEVAPGRRLLVFGTTPSPQLTREEDPDRRAKTLASAAPSALVPWPATNYRRWTNFAWGVVEEGGQAKAGAWTPAEAARLKAIVKRAHDRGLWIRFYTLNGHTAESNQGWTAGYNFGSPDAVRARWEAAIEAGIDFIATDQYEGLAALLATKSSSP